MHSDLVMVPTCQPCPCNAMHARNTHKINTGFQLPRCAFIHLISWACDAPLPHCFHISHTVFNDFGGDEKWILSIVSLSLCSYKNSFFSTMMDPSMIKLRYYEYPVGGTYVGLTKDSFIIAFVLVLNQDVLMRSCTVLITLQSQLVRK